jgi:hypothetical protein
MITTLGVAIVLALSSAATAFAQRGFNHTYPARDNVRLELKNLFGTVTVEGWNRNEIKVNASMESPAARFTPQRTETGLIIDVLHDNSARGDVGDVNFQIYVPYNTIVDLETRRGNIRVNGIQGGLVRAHVSSEGDIELTGIRSGTVMASNTTGNILFDGELAKGGKYEFKSWQGDINIRIPARSCFQLTASAPMSRSITLGGFDDGHLNFMGEGRKVVGIVNEEKGVNESRASVAVSNYRGRISFLTR